MAQNGYGMQNGANTKLLKERTPISFGLRLQEQSSRPQISVCHVLTPERPSLSNSSAVLCRLFESQGKHPYLSLRVLEETRACDMVQFHNEDPMLDCFM